jgi:hypothetical protein
MKKKIYVIAALSLGLAAPALADPSIGIGLSLSFGAGKAETSVGVRLLSDNRRDKAAASLGLDYMLQSQRIRPTVGVAYLGHNNYIGADMGFVNGGLDFGLSAGGVKTKTKAAPAVVAPAIVPTPKPGPL